MVIQTFERKYKVLHLLQSYLFGDAYVAEEESCRERYTILRVSDGTIVSKLVAYLSLEIHKEIFSDFEEFFFSEGSLCIVTKYQAGISLEEKLREEVCSLRERIEIAKKLFEKMVLLDMPVYFQQSCLQVQTIRIHANAEVSFVHLLSDLPCFQSVNQNDIRIKLMAVYREIFKEELANESIAPLTEFYQYLQNTQDIIYMDLYEQYVKLCGNLPVSNEPAQPKTFLFRMWERIKQSFGLLKKILILLLMAAACGYLLYVLFYSDRYGAYKQCFSQIGTVEIVQSN